MNWFTKSCGQILLFFWLNSNARPQTLDLPSRPANALSGSEFARGILELDRTNREEKIYEQIILGNVPDFLRKLATIRVTNVQAGQTNSAIYYVTPDYLAIGSDEDYFFAPLSPIIAQKVADRLHCALPTRKMVNDIYAAAAVKLEPSPIPPSPAMATVPIFIQHNEMVRKQREAQLKEHPLGSLVAGDKKDVVITPQLSAHPGKVAIYGWHKLDGKPIQPLYLGHADWYADYSHGIRLAQIGLTVNDASQTMAETLTNAALSRLLSDEGTISTPRYPPEFQTPKTPVISPKPATTNVQIGLYDDQLVSYGVEPEVKVTIDSPKIFAPGKKLKLIFYALPNGNTTEQTIGRALNPGDDWHFDIQNIGAQTRFLRNEFTNQSLVVVYLEASQKSWPAWRKKHAAEPQLIPQIINAVKSRFSDYEVQVTLSGHSGGGSLIFGYINAVEKIPNDLERIAFLDANYAYDEKSGHAKKLLDWLNASDQHYLSVLAYQDAVALLNGKTFVSAAGGTWGRSHAMLQDFGGQIKFTSQTNSGLETFTALDGRVKFLLKENPEQKILHTVQVERNGFIQSLLSGTPLEGRSYVYFGDRAYTNAPAHP